MCHRRTRRRNKYHLQDLGNILRTEQALGQSRLGARIGVVREALPHQDSPVDPDVLGVVPDARRRGTVDRFLEELDGNGLATANSGSTR